MINEGQFSEFTSSLQSYVEGFRSLQQEKEEYTKLLKEKSESLAFDRMKIVDLINQITDGKSISEMIDDGIYIPVVSSSEMLDYSALLENTEKTKELSLEEKQLFGEFNLREKFRELSWEVGYTLAFRLDVFTGKRVVEIGVAPHANDETYRLIDKIYSNGLKQLVANADHDMIIYHELTASDWKKSRIEFNYDVDGFKSVTKFTITPQITVGEIQELLVKNNGDAELPATASRAELNAKGLINFEEVRSLPLYKQLHEFETVLTVLKSFE